MRSKDVLVTRLIMFSQNCVIWPSIRADSRLSPRSRVKGPDIRIHIGAGGRFKNTYELLNLRALNFSPVDKIHIFQCIGNIFCVEFQRYHLKFHTTKTAAFEILALQNIYRTITAYVYKKKNDREVNGKGRG